MQTRARPSLLIGAAIISAALLLLPISPLSLFSQPARDIDIKQTLIDPRTRNDQTVPLTDPSNAEGSPPFKRSRPNNEATVATVGEISEKIERFARAVDALGNAVKNIATVTNTPVEPFEPTQKPSSSPSPSPSPRVDHPSQPEPVKTRVVRDDDAVEMTVDLPDKSRNVILIKHGDLDNDQLPQGDFSLEYRRSACAKSAHRLTHDELLVCTDGLNSKSVVYSFGLGQHAEFELSLIDKFGATVHAFDPSPNSKKFAENIQNGKFHFHQYSLNDKDGPLKLYTPKDPTHVSLNIRKHPVYSSDTQIETRGRTLKSLMDEIGDKYLDLVHIHADGLEIPAVEQLIADNFFPANQIMINFTPENVNNGEERQREIGEKLKEKGFELFHLSNMDRTFIRYYKPKAIGGT